MTDTIFFILSLSIVFAAIIGAVRFASIDQTYRPFIYYAWLAVFVEVVVYVLMSSGLTNVVGTVYNIFGLLEFFLWVWLFHNWGLFKRNERNFLVIIALALLLFACSLFIRGYNKINYFSQIVNSFALIFFSISAFNTMILSERKNIFKNAKFWICIGIIIYYTCFILVYTEKLSFLNLHPSKTFDYKVWAINAYANLLVNLLYAVAVLWIPRKKNIITLF